MPMAQVTSSSPSCELAPGEFAWRVAQARRDGTPAWLWPDVDRAAWREALAELERVAREVLCGARSVRLEGDSDALSLAAYTSGLGPLLGWWLDRGSIETPADIRTMLEGHLAHNAERNARLQEQARNVAKALGDRGIDAVFLKGAHTALDYFPAPGTRPQSDIDVLIRAGDAEAASDVLSTTGLRAFGQGRHESSWRPVGGPIEPQSLMFVHRDDPWTIDLHYTLDRYVDAGTPFARLDLGDPMSHPLPWTGGATAGVLRQPLLLLHLAVHAGNGLHSLTLLRLVELVLVIRQDREAGRLSWPDFASLAERTGSLGYAYPALRLCDQLVPGTIPTEILAACARAAPARARAVIARHTPASAHRVDRNSLAEHFMWTRGAKGWAAKLASDVIPSERWTRLKSVYRARFWQVGRGRVSR